MSGFSPKTSSFPFIVIRLWPHHHRCEDDLRDLLEALKRNRAACDEVWFCTELGFPPVAEHARSAALMAKAAQAVRALGIEPGLQIANTLGHGGLNLLQDNSAAVWPFMIGPDGREGPPSPCPRAPEALEYLDRLSRLYAQWKPSSIWIDDDLRMSNHGTVIYGCFCPVCVREFSATQGRAFDRPTLAEALNHPTDGSVRLTWTRFNGDSLAGIAGVVARAVHEVAPDCRLGLQQIGHEPFLYSGPDWNPILERMARETGLPARSRLGHGYYTDHAPRQLLGKVGLIARQVSRLPACVDQICPEVENYTHNAFGKSAHGTVVESALDLAVGCNSLSYALLCSGHEPMSWYETLLARIAAWRPFWENYVRLNAGTAPGGVEVRLGMEHVARAVSPGEPPFAWARVDLDRAYALACLGLPLCAANGSAGATLLHADVVAGLSDGELRALLKGGAMMDGLAALRVQERGCGDLLGVRVSPTSQPLPFNERLSRDPLNGVYAGMAWNASVNPSGVFMLEPLSPDVRALGLYEDRLGVAGGMATVLAGNGEGGRVAVFGYYGWDSAPSGAKRNQYLAAADWIARGKLPAVIQTTAQVMVVPRVTPAGRLVSVFLLNTSIDRTPPLELRLRGVQARTARWLVPEQLESELVFSDDGADKLCRTPPLAAWSVACVAIR